MAGILYIIPVLLGENNPEEVIPAATLQHTRRLKHFIVEKEKSARQFLKAALIQTPQSELHIVEMDKHADQDGEIYLKSLLEGNDTGLLSEAGAPAVADPGSMVIHAAHRKGIKVIPLVGPSAILLALMASGLNGQSFCFHGYLPIESEEKIKKIKQLEKDAAMRKQTQLFIETPYRNMPLLKDLVNHLSDHVKLCIACNLTLSDEYIKTQTIAKWKNNLPDINKKPCVFLIL